MMDSTQPTTILSPWQRLCLRRLHRLLDITPGSAPPELDPMEAFALIAWSRMAVYADCHDAGVGPTARTILREHLEARDVAGRGRDL